jgi:translation elongation factor EF-G
MVYLRVYSGELTPATEVYNSTRQAKERVSRLLSIQADDMVSAKSDTYCDQVVVSFSRARALSICHHDTSLYVAS